MKGTQKKFNTNKQRPLFSSNAMMAISLSFLILLISIESQAQTIFKYDASGNRLKTTKVAMGECNVCPSQNIAYRVPLVDGTEYQWQVNKGSGFADIADDTVYSGSTSAALVLIKPPTSWYGYKYRCTITDESSSTLSPEYTLKFYNTWKGTVNISWENFLNWSCKELPDENTDVIVTSARFLLLNSDARVRTMSLNPGANFRVNGSRKLDILK